MVGSGMMLLLFRLLWMLLATVIRTLVASTHDLNSVLAVTVGERTDGGTPEYQKKVNVTIE
jgi:hypothetical protein